MAAHMPTGIMPVSITVFSNRGVHGFKLALHIFATSFFDYDLFYVFKSVSMRKPGRTRQEVIQLKSPISLKLGINVEFGE